MSEEISEIKVTEFMLEIPSIGVGTMRTSATWIALMLMSERNPEFVIVSVMKELNISPEKINEIYYDKACDKCGISLLAHRRKFGECP